MDQRVIQQQNLMALLGAIKFTQCQMQIHDKESHYVSVF